LSVRDGRQGIAAVCAIYGGFDLVPPVPEGFDDCVLVTDVPVRSGWRNVVAPSVLSPRLAAKHPKCRPDLYTQCQQSVWLDGSAHVIDDSFAEQVRGLLQRADLVVWDHPEDRDCLYQEADHCHSWPKYRSEPLREQVEHYRQLGMPDRFGLWALGSIARNHTEEMRDFGDAWLAEMSRWTIQDQVSFPFLLWAQGLEVETFEGDQLENRFVRWAPHADEVWNHRRTMLSLESEIIHLRGDIDHLTVALTNVNAELARLLRRRVVRAALALARPFKPVMRALRGERADVSRRARARPVHGRGSAP
jgi:hypothetical protein